MVFIVDKDGTFDEPLDKIWRFLTSQSSAHSHPGNMNVQTETQDGHTILSYENVIPGANGTVKHKLKMTMIPPVAMTMEYLEGPLAGSKTVQYYQPKGINRTDVVVVGEYTSNVIPEAQLKTLVLRNLDQVFREDQENLRRFE